ncbi:MAG: hypothetical protein GY794_08730 [bacterium]|nr:hypothetical protein [bacterium]
MKLTCKSKVLLLSVCMLILLTNGCGSVMYFVWPWGRTVTVPAEFDGLKNQRVAVVVFASENTQYEYPWVVMNLSSMISAKLNDEIEGITTIAPQKIAAYQHKNVHWAGMDKTALGKALGADFILHISLVEFSTVEEGYVDLLRGRINGEVKVYDCSKPESDTCVWTCDNIRVKFPKTATVRNAKNESNIHSIIMMKFSEKLTKNFYSYKVNREDQ